MKRRFKAKNLILSVVALILVMMLAVGVTYSWIEDVKQVQFSTNQDGDEAPLKTGTDINAVAEIVQDSTNHNTINLGNILQDSDLKDNSGNFKNNIDAANVNAKKGYFYESGGMHLSPCYSDGVDFYFPIRNSNGSEPSSGVRYRKGNKNDENVNYIDFTFKVSSPDANTVYWFDDFPYIKTAGTQSSYNNQLTAARLAITVDGVTKIMSFNGETNEGYKVTSLNSTTTVYTPDKYAKYIYGDSTYNPNNANTLFSVAKGETKNVNVKIWIDAGVANSATVTDIDIPITSSWAKKIKFNVEDKTSGYWAIKSNDACKYYVAFPSYYDTYNGWVANKNYFEFDSYNRSGHTATFEVPTVYSGEYAYIYRCTSSGWNHGDNNLPNSNDKQPNNSHPINAHNYWKTTLPNSYKPTNSDTYKFYGGAYDTSMAQAIESNTNKATHLGAGTWGNLIEIKLKSQYRCKQGYMGHTENESDATDFATSTAGTSYIRDFSDESTVGTIYTYKMTWDSTNKWWWTYAPETSKLIQFYYYANDTDKGWWGYRSDNNQCPQQRPDGVTEYQIAGNYADKKGVAGYWEGQNKVYFIKNGKLAYKDHIYDYMYIGNGGYGNENASFPGVEMSDTGRTFAPDSSPIYESSTVYSYDNLYCYVIFNQGNSTDQSAALFIYAGCYFDYEHAKWYGSIDGQEINTNVTDTTGDTSLSGGITTYPPSDNNVYLSVTLNSSTTYYKIGNAVNDSINIQLSQSNNYTTRLIKNGTNYGRNDNNPNSHINPNGEEFLYYQANEIERMHVSTPGKYNVKIKAIDNNSYTIKYTLVAS